MLVLETPQVSDVTSGRETHKTFQSPKQQVFRQIVRFSLVGGINTLVDLLILNGLLFLFPTNDVWLLVLYTVLAYSVGAVNSFILNKYWTFERKRQTNGHELVRFAITTLCGIGWNGACIWLAARIDHPTFLSAVAWTNLSKIAAIASAAFLSYLGMRLWVFVKPVSQEKRYVA